MQTPIGASTGKNSALDSVIFDRWIEQMEFAGDKILVSD